MSQQNKLHQLKELLLHEDRDEIALLQEKIKQLEGIIEKQEQLAYHVDPIIDKKLEEYTNDSTRV